MGLTVYGSSDDLIEVEGDVREEFYVSQNDDGDYLAFSSGVVLRIHYTNAGVWRITPVAGASRVTIDHAPEDDEDNYSDRATLHESASWVVHGIHWARAK